MWIRARGAGIVLPQHLSASARGDYSTTEVDTGREWIDGKAIYRKLVDFGALPNNTEHTVSLGVSNVGQIVSMSGVAVHQNKTALCLPYAHPNNVNLSVAMYVSSAGAVGLQSGADRSAYRAYIAVEYTKS